MAVRFYATVDTEFLALMARIEGANDDTRRG